MPGRLNYCDCGDYCLWCMSDQEYEELRSPAEQSSVQGIDFSSKCKHCGLDIMICDCDREINTQKETV
jgi:hypothetical protein